MSEPQRNILNDIVVDSSIIYPLLMIVDTSEGIREYSPDILELGINKFFSHIGQSKDINKVIELSIYESNEDFEYLEGFQNPSNLFIDGIKIGGKWNLPYAISCAIDILSEIYRLYVRKAQYCITPLLIVISDNITPDNGEIYECLAEKIKIIQDNKLLIPNCIFVTPDKSNYFVKYISNLTFKSVDSDNFVNSMRDLANEIINNVSNANNFN